VSYQQQKIKRCHKCNYSNPVRRVAIKARFSSKDEAMIALKYFKIPKNKRSEVLEEISTAMTSKTLGVDKELNDFIKKVDELFPNGVTKKKLEQLASWVGILPDKLESKLRKMRLEGSLIFVKQDILKFVL